MAKATAWDVPAGYEDWGLLTTTSTSDVYVATSRADGVRTVVKILRVDAETEANSLFVEGTDAAVVLPAHPLIVPVIGRGLTSGGRPWVAMPFLAYGSLSDRLAAEGALDPQLVTELFVWVADALAFSTSTGVLHRDVKPGNILFDAEGRPVLADFQTAVRLRPGRQSATTASLTDQYAAPEVLVHGRYTTQSEVFSVCASMLQALGGRPPHEMRPGEPLGAYLARVDAGTAAEQVILPGAPQPLVDVLRQGLAHDPDLRPRGPAGLSAALRGVQAAVGWPVTGPVESAPPPDPPTVIRRRPLPAGDPDVTSPPAAPWWRLPRQRLALLVSAIVVGLLIAGSAGQLRLAGSGGAAAAPLPDPGRTEAEPVTQVDPTSPTSSGASPSSEVDVRFPAPQGREPRSGDSGRRPSPAERAPSAPDGPSSGPDGPSSGPERPSSTPVEPPSPAERPRVEAPPVPPLVIDGLTLGEATVGLTYLTVLGATGGRGPYVWDVQSGSPPGGLDLSSDGQLTGTPVNEGSADFVVRVTDAEGRVATAATTLSAVPLHGDINRDGALDCTDQDAMEAVWDWGAGTRAGSPADLDGDSSVDVRDWAILSPLIPQC